jgi:hypothetical protein
MKAAILHGWPRGGAPNIRLNPLPEQLRESGDFYGITYLNSFNRFA